MTLTQATWNCAKVMLSLTLPLQVIIKTDRPRNTHDFCNQQAIEIIRRDGLHREGQLLQSYLELLNKGSRWSDQGFKNISHYYHYQRGTGLWHGPDAPTECQYFFEKAVKYWRAGYQEKSIFYLGAASHILQDLCVPHHACGVVLKGHKFFEDWARGHYHEFSVKTEGIYQLSSSARGWVKENARVSSAYLPELMNNKGITSVQRTAGNMLQLAQRTTAGFLHFFFQRIK
ncbi:phospholipase C zinc-binding protein [Desulforamulus reducens MI-1]|uniref:Phospholipase C n=1 Tax=Desulforamulus reducens (strain ATCC BAA-1160 / DSM 100696 / MI-1) TaxID=349161 RepID=A4J842_DESRM|nr:zinc dependent phospholipase C family protein [Desulforamulus reducens]ABO51245.1 phospholipase C zinc-binding protein [Desulforamulus reducens MI-1]